MKPIQGAKPIVSRPNSIIPLPAGNYVAKIMNCKEEMHKFPSGDEVMEIVFQLDVA